MRGPFQWVLLEISWILSFFGGRGEGVGDILQIGIGIPLVIFQSPNLKQHHCFLVGIHILGGGFKYFVFSPLFGEDEHILTNIFQMGWFNHQPG